MHFDWDDANLLHIAEHNVDAAEVEYVILNDPRDVEVRIRGGEERIVQVGATARGRIVTVVSTLHGASVRVVTAYDTRSFSL